MELRNEKLILTARKESLASVLGNIRHYLKIVIIGLAYRKEEIITFAINGGSPEGIIKKLLQHLGERNYALEFADEQLKIHFADRGCSD